LKGLIQASHPFPVVMVVGLTLAIGLVSTRGLELDRWRFLLVGAAMLFSQLSIGWHNDYVDREVDRRHQPGKPVAGGRVRPRTLALLSPAALALSLLLAATLGWLPLLIFTLGSACGFAYNLGIKDTRLSPVPYLLAFALLPPYVWTGLDAWRAEFLGLYLVGAPLVLAVHVANTLPDVESDRAAGRMGIVARLGRGNSLALLALCLVASVAFALVFALVVSCSRPALLVGVTATCAALAALAGLTYAAGVDRRGFMLVALAAALFASGWLASV
jgi:4-hydroxybenzoate polyprenyltransferase